MKAYFKQNGLHETVVVLEPEHGTEAMLLAAWMRYEANVISLSVDRFEDGQIQRCELSASDAR